MNDNMKRILAVDSGSERIGLAISDETGTIANPLTVIKHIKRELDAEKITSIANEYSVKTIIVGQSFSADGTPNPSGRKSARLAEVIQKMIEIPVLLWDEFETTKIAQKAMREMKTKKKRYQSHADDLAATVLLQSYLDAQSDHYSSEEIYSE